MLQYSILQKYDKYDNTLYVLRLYVHTSVATTNKGAAITLYLFIIWTAPWHNVEKRPDTPLLTINMPRKGIKNGNQKTIRDYLPCDFFNLHVYMIIK